MVNGLPIISIIMNNIHIIRFIRRDDDDDDDSNDDSKENVCNSPLLEM